MTTQWIFINEGATWTDTGVTPNEEYVGGRIHEFDRSVQAEADAADRLLASGNGLDTGHAFAAGNPIKVSDGSAAAPAIAPNSDADTGFYFPAAGEIGVAVAGVLRATFAAAALTMATPVAMAGNDLILDADSDSKFVTSADDRLYLQLGGATVGDWTSSRFDLSGTGEIRLPNGSAASPTLNANADQDTGLYWLGSNVVGASAGGLEVWRWNAYGVHVNTTSGSGQLNVNGGTDIAAEFARTDNGQILELDGSGYSAHHTLDGTAYFIGHNSGSRGIGFQTASTTRLFIAAGGNVGMGGQTAPLYALDVIGDIRATGGTAAAGYVRIAADNGASDTHLYQLTNDDFYILNNNAAGSIFIRARDSGSTVRTLIAADTTSGVRLYDNAGTEAVRVNPSGFVGINSTGPSTYLEVGNDKNYTGTTPNSASYAFTVETPSGPGVGIGSHNDQPAIQGYGAGTGYDLYLNPANGDVAIGMASNPGARLEVRGAARISDAASQYIGFDPSPATSAYTHITSLTNTGVERNSNSAGRPHIWKLAGTEYFRVDTNTGATGGTGSAGAGNQYVELNIKGQRYRLLHDGTI